MGAQIARRADRVDAARRRRRRGARVCYGAPAEEHAMEHKGFTVWFTGLSGAGKTTLAERVGADLRGRGLKVELLDGDVVRTNLSKGLGFSKEDRDINIRRIGFVCHLLSRNGVVAIASAISPYRAVRDENPGVILIAEHLCNLGELPEQGYTFHAVPPKFKGVGTFPVRAYARLDAS